MRKIEASEVTFTLEIEPDDSPVEGNFISGDPDYEKQEREFEAELIARLKRGDHEAWCGVVVTANWRGHTGKASIWGNSLSDAYTAEMTATEHGLKAEALDDLNRSVAKYLNQASEIATLLK